MADFAQPPQWNWDSSRRERYYIRGGERIYEKDYAHNAAPSQSYAVPANRAEHDRGHNYTYPQSYTDPRNLPQPITYTQVSPQHNSQHGQPPLNGYSYQITHTSYASSSSVHPSYPSQNVSFTYPSSFPVQPSNAYSTLPQGQTGPQRPYQNVSDYTQNNSYPGPSSHYYPASRTLHYGSQENDHERQRDDRNDRNRHGRNGWRDSGGNGGQYPHDGGHEDDQRDSDEETQSFEKHESRRYPGEGSNFESYYI